MELEEIAELCEKLQRWSEIADKTFKGDWCQCSLLHSFGDRLANDLRKAKLVIETLTP